MVDDDEGTRREIQTLFRTRTNTPVSFHEKWESLVQ